MDQVTDLNDSIVFKDVSLTRGHTPVLQGINLALTERRIGLIGRNGAGKSSLIGLMNGLLSPSGGTLSVHGLDATENRADLPRRVGMVFQNPDHQIVFPTVIEEIAFTFEMAGHPRRDAKAQAAAYLENHALSDWAERAVHSLSEGQKHWLCILSVLAGGPDVLILDEPFSSLDLANRIGLRRKLHDLPQQVILVSHDLEALADFDRIIWLQDGGVHRDGPPDDILPAYRADAERTNETETC